LSCGQDELFLFLLLGFLNVAVTFGRGTAAQWPVIFSKLVPFTVFVFNVPTSFGPASSTFTISG